MNKYIVKGEHNEVISLYNLDSLEGMKKEIADSSIDVVVTSPPYNIGVEYGSYYDKRPREEYLNWIVEISKEIRRVLNNDGSFFLNVGGKPSDPWIPFDIINQIRNIFIVQNVIHWVKSIAINGSNATNHETTVKRDITVGHYKPIGGQRFLNDCHEYIFHLTKTGSVKLDRLAIGVPYQDKSNIGRWKAAKQDKRCRGNTWFIPYDTIKNRAKERPHPSTFPIKLPEMCILLHGLNRTKNVLDPFMGIGSTALACLQLGVSCLGFEIDKTYYDVSVARVNGVLTSTTLFGRDYGPVRSHP